MSFIRPEARTALWRWREVALGALVAGLGLWLILTAHGVLNWLGWPIAALGLAFLIAGLQRARIRLKSGGVGLIELDEAQLTCFLPGQGGVTVPLPSVIRIEIESGRVPTWCFTDEQGRTAQIPASAEGAERLIDALAHFPGADYARVAEASRSGATATFLIWRLGRAQRAATSLTQSAQIPRRLH
ncbi:hypothetical protein [Rhodalgimonas zhirmunskyi]|uniref:Uncharacterized protein n=1 Tax=Rhodalgimonas zhirmunskyi TaxID=2964767 RepID=A0AAJ1UC41_9RHOB|nr:hypothetical protein [Rhodoalgimonas zhirmunskyi]MDQ2093836.1 hypothetical protein [Rhodoalgimonas zhirmunskyi]